MFTLGTTEWVAVVRGFREEEGGGALADSVRDIHCTAVSSSEGTHTFG